MRHLQYQGTQTTFCFNNVNALPSEDYLSEDGSVERCNCRNCLLHYRTYHQELVDSATRRLEELVGT